MDKKKRKEMLKQYKKNEKSEFEKSLPFHKEVFEELFDYIDNCLEDEECDDTLKYTKLFLENNQLPVEQSIGWLKENGGYCDCEVLFNIEDKILEI